MALSHDSNTPHAIGLTSHEKNKQPHGIPLSTNRLETLEKAHGVLEGVVSR